MRWLVVYKRLFKFKDGHCDHHSDVTDALEGIGKSTQNAIISRFLATGGVDTHGNGRQGGTHGTVMTAELEVHLFQKVLDDPKATLHSHSMSFMLEHGVSIHISTLCRAMRRLGLSHQQVLRTAAG